MPALRWRVSSDSIRSTATAAIGSVDVRKNGFRAETTRRVTSPFWESIPNCSTTSSKSSSTMYPSALSFLAEDSPNRAAVSGTWMIALIPVAAR